MNYEEELIEIFMKTLHRYLEKHGEKIASMTKATGQKRIKIALRGLFWFYEADIPEYPKLTMLIEEILREPKLLKMLEQKGFKIITYENEYYIEASVEKILGLMSKEKE